jgi:hypothetical protein
VLGLEEIFQRTCFDHVFFEVCKYATTNEKVCKGLKYVRIKATQGDL